MGYMVKCEIYKCHKVGWLVNYIEASLKMINLEYPNFWA